MANELTWDTTDITWETIDFLWNDIWLLQQVIIPPVRKSRKQYENDPLHRHKYTPGDEIVIDDYDPNAENEWDEELDFEDMLDQVGEEGAKRVIKLVCQFKNITYSDERELKDIRITINDVRQTMAEAEKKINVTIHG